MHGVKTVEYSNISNILLLVTSVISLLPTKINPVQSSNKPLYVQKSHCIPWKHALYKKHHSLPKYPTGILQASSLHTMDPPDASHPVVILTAHITNPTWLNQKTCYREMCSFNYFHADTLCSKISSYSSSQMITQF